MSRYDSKRPKVATRNRAKQRRVRGLLPGLTPDEVKRLATDVTRAAVIPWTDMSSFTFSLNGEPFTP